MFDKQSLLDPVGWMTDTIINAAQILIKQQFPHIQSLQDVALGQAMSFHVQMGEFLQIIYYNNHWFTISSIGVSRPTVKACIPQFLHWEEFKFPVFSAHQRI